MLAKRISNSNSNVNDETIIEKEDELLSQQDNKREKGEESRQKMVTLCLPKPPAANMRCRLNSPNSTARFTRRITNLNRNIWSSESSSIEMNRNSKLML